MAIIILGNSLGGYFILLKGKYNLFFLGGYKHYTQEYASFIICSKK